MSAPLGMRLRYARIARRCEQRFGKPPPPLPSDPMAAGNLLRRLVAELNDTRPIRIKRGDPLHVSDKEDEAPRPRNGRPEEPRGR